MIRTSDSVKPGSSVSSHSKKGKHGEKSLYASNRKAFYDYAVLETTEAGIVLNGSEVKSVKTGLASIKDAVVSVDRGEMWLYNTHVPQWSASTIRGYDPLRKRKLLLHRREIDTLMGKAKEKRLTLIPLKLYRSHGRVKVQIGLCKGKKVFEKKIVERERQLKRELHEEKRKYML